MMLKLAVCKTKRGEFVGEKIRKRYAFVDKIYGLFWRLK